MGGKKCPGKKFPETVELVWPTVALEREAERKSLLKNEEANSEREARGQNSGRTQTIEFTKGVSKEEHYPRASERWPEEFRGLSLIHI